MALQSVFSKKIEKETPEELEKKIAAARSQGVKLTRVNFDMEPEDYKKVKSALALKGLTIREYIVGLIKSDLGI